MVELRKRNHWEIFNYNPDTGEKMTLGRLAKRLEISNTLGLPPEGVLQRFYYSIKEFLMNLIPEPYYHSKREQRINNRLESI